MIINISDLTTKKCENIFIDTEVNLENLSRGGDIFNFTEPVDVKGKLYRLDENIWFSGTVNTTVHTQCSRCLDDVVKKISLDFDEIIVVDNKDKAYDIIIDVENDCMSLGDFLERLLILKFPMRFLCREDCKGLCPQCGINLNHSECECTQEDIDVRLIKLKELLSKD